MRSMSIVISRASCRSCVRCSRIISLIWSPMVCTGERLAIGSWKIMEISRPRMARMVGPSGGSSSSSTASPSPGVKVMVPFTVRPGEGTMRRMDCVVTLLPHPLSPITPTVLWRVIVKETPLSAFRIPSRRKKWVSTFRSSNAMSLTIRPLAGSLVGVRGVAQAIAEKVEGDERDNKDQTGIE